MKAILVCLTATTLLAALVPPVNADQAADEQAIRANAASYAAAYNKRDAKALAAHWLPDAVYIDPETGKNFAGRAAIEKHFAEIFDGDRDSRLTVEVASVRFVSPNVAVEQGTAMTAGLSKEPVKSDYTAIHVRRDGKWLLDRVSDSEIVPVISNYDRLKNLEWLVGDWADTGSGTRVKINCKWAKNQSFLIRTFTVSVDNNIETSGVQFIGWDPTQKKIRSWVFDSSGGFGSGLWTKKGDSWHIVTTDTLPSGEQTSSVNILQQVDNNRFTWQAVNRQAAGEMLPNLEATIERQSADQ